MKFRDKIVTDRFNRYVRLHTLIKRLMEFRYLPFKYKILNYLIVKRNKCKSELIDRVNVLG